MRIRNKNWISKLINQIDFSKQDDHTCVDLARVLQFQCVNEDVILEISDGYTIIEAIVSVKDIEAAKIFLDPKLDDTSDIEDKYCLKNNMTIQIKRLKILQPGSEKTKTLGYLKNHFVLELKQIEWFSDETVEMFTCNNAVYVSQICQKKMEELEIHHRIKKLKQYGESSPQNTISLQSLGLTGDKREYVKEFMRTNEKFRVFVSNRRCSENPSQSVTYVDTSMKSLSNLVGAFDQSKSQDYEYNTSPSKRYSTSLLKSPNYKRIRLSQDREDKSEEKIDAIIDDDPVKSSQPHTSTQAFTQSYPLTFNVSPIAAASQLEITDADNHNKSIEESSMSCKEKHKQKYDEERRRLNSLSISGDSFQTAPNTHFRGVEEPDSAICSTQWKSVEQEENDRLEKMKQPQETGDDLTNLTEDTSRSIEFRDSQHSESKTDDNEAVSVDNSEKSSKNIQSEYDSSQDKRQTGCNSTQPSDETPNSESKITQDLELTNETESKSKLILISSRGKSSELVRYLTDEDFEEPRVIIEKPTFPQKVVEESEFFTPAETCAQGEENQLTQLSCITQDESTQKPAQNVQSKEMTSQGKTDSQGDEFFDAQEHFSCITDDGSQEIRKTPHELNEDDEQDVIEDSSENLTREEKIDAKCDKNNSQATETNFMSIENNTDKEKSEEEENVVSRIESPEKVHSKDTFGESSAGISEERDVTHISDSDDSFPSIIEPTAISPNPETPQKKNGMEIETPNQSLKPFQIPPSTGRKFLISRKRTNNDSLSQLLSCKNSGDGDQERKRLVHKTNKKIESVLNVNDKTERKRIVKEWFESW